MTKIYGLIGFPLDHSYSKTYFERMFKSERIENCEYLNFPIDSILKIHDIISDNLDLIGFNVTMPYKTAIIPYLDKRTAQVNATSAANCVLIERGDTIKLNGYNTDVFAFQKSLSKNLKDYHTKALIIGNGSTSRTIEYVLRKLNIEYKIVSRKQGLRIENITKEMMSEHLLIINATPIGMGSLENHCPGIPYHYITNRHLLYDLVYNPAETIFLKRGAEKGAMTMNGMNMLNLQADLSWYIWNMKNKKQND